jgi:hypothetical protein
MLQERAGSQRGDIAVDEFSNMDGKLWHATPKTSESARSFVHSLIIADDFTLVFSYYDHMT